MVHAFVTFALLSLVFLAKAPAGPHAAVIGIPGTNNDAELQADIQMLRSATAKRALQWVQLPTEGAATSWHLVQQRIVDAKILLTQFADKDALIKLLEAEKALSSVSIGAKDAEILVELNLLAARACLSLRKKHCVQQRLQLVHSLTPNLVRLDTKQFPPGLAKAYRHAVAKQARRERPLRLGVLPVGATLSVDGRAVQADSTQVFLSAGDHYLTTNADGFRTQTLRISEDIRSIDIQLQRQRPGQRISELVQRIHVNPKQTIVLQELMTIANLDILYIIRGTGEVLQFEKGTLLDWRSIAPISVRVSTKTLASPTKPLLVTPTLSSNQTWHQKRTTKIIGTVALIASATAFFFVLSSGNTKDDSSQYESGIWEWNLP